jgi:hypothetical protein
MSSREPAAADPGRASDDESEDEERPEEADESDAASPEATDASAEEAPDRSDGGEETSAVEVDDAAENGENGGDETVPAVEIELYQLSVSVSGQSDDSLEDIEGTARRLMDYLVEQAQSLEDAPDNRGLG